MAIKKFSAYINEGTGTSAASNFVAPKDSDEEVTKYKPRSKGEEDFANAHTVTKHDYPVDVEAQFSGGNTQKPRQPNNGEKNVKQGSTDVNQPKGGGDSRRGADKKQGDMKPVNPVKEEVELDELKKYDKNADFRILNRLSQKEKSGKLTSAEKQQMANARARLRNHGVNEKVEMDEISPELAKKAYDARAKRVDRDRTTSDALRKAADRQKDQRKATDLKRSAYARDQERRSGEDKLDRSARKAGMSDKEAGEKGGAYDKATDTRSPTEKYRDYRQDGGKLSYNDYKARYLKNSFDPMEEGLELFEGKVLDALQDIVKTKSAKKVKFANGKSTPIDMTTANAMVNLHKKLSPDRKKKMEDAIEKSPEMLMRLMDVAFKG